MNKFNTVLILYEYVSRHVSHLKFLKNIKLPFISKRRYIDNYTSFSPNVFKICIYWMKYEDWAIS